MKSRVRWRITFTFMAYISEPFHDVNKVSRAVRTNGNLYDEFVQVAFHSKLMLKEEP